MKTINSTTRRRLKRAIALLAIGLWLILMRSIFLGGGGMAEQAPKCLFTTMIVFGILTAAYKGIDLFPGEEQSGE